MDKETFCENCKHWYNDEGRSRAIGKCENDKSQYFNMYTQNYDGCEQFEEEEN